MCLRLRGGTRGGWDVAEYLACMPIELRDIGALHYSKTMPNTRHQLTQAFFRTLAGAATIQWWCIYILQQYAENFVTVRQPKLNVVWSDRKMWRLTDFMSCALHKNKGSMILVPPPSSHMLSILLPYAILPLGRIGTRREYWWIDRITVSRPRHMGWPFS